MENKFRNTVNLVADSFRLSYYRVFKSGETFTFRGREYNYFYHGYNMTHMNERAVEMSIALTYLQEYSGKAVLELGNVLSHYTRATHDIIDKYEQAPGVLNVDITEFQPDKKYDLILSVSTLEHVGFDEDVKDPDKVIRAVEALKSCRADNGKVVVTFPLGYNLDLDRKVAEGLIPLDNLYFMKRISQDNRWKEVDYDEVSKAEFSSPYRSANGLAIGIH